MTRGRGNLSNIKKIPRLIMKKTYYIGLDVHKETVSISYTDSRSRSEAIYYGTCGGSNLAVERALRKLAKQLGVRLQDLEVCYEAGPTGFVLGRRLIQLGVNCVLCSPSKTERQPTERIKTDKRDSQKIAKMLRSGDFTPVRIPPKLDEAVRDLCRARTDAMEDVCRAKRQLLSFLLRNGIRYTGKSNWTPSHMKYLRELTMPSDPQKIALEFYITAIDYAESRSAELKKEMIKLLEDWEWKPVVKALMACRGFQEVAAMTVISELGDLRRFSSPRKLMAFVGLVPSEHSSGGSRRQAGITKCGNSHARWILVECAQHFRRAPKVGKALTERQLNQPPNVKELSWRMQKRLNSRYVKLKMRGKRENKCIVAVARELVAFIWELQNKCNLTMPEPSELEMVR